MAGTIVTITGYTQPDPYQMAIDGAGNIYYAEYRR
jgi:hypothetical protein